MIVARAHDAVHALRSDTLLCNTSTVRVWQRGDARLLTMSTDDRVEARACCAAHGCARAPPCARCACVSRGTRSYACEPYAYVRAAVEAARAPMRLATTTPRALTIGLGGAVLTRLLREPVRAGAVRAHVDVIESDPNVVRAARSLFAWEPFGTERLAVADPAHALATVLRERTYDVVVVDCMVHGVVPHGCLPKTLGPALRARLARHARVVHWAWRRDRSALLLGYRAMGYDARAQLVRASGGALTIASLNATGARAQPGR
jgi:hypothetical protein